MDKTHCLLDINYIADNKVHLREKKSLCHQVMISFAAGGRMPLEKHSIEFFVVAVYA